MDEIPSGLTAEQQRWGENQLLFIQHREKAMREIRLELTGIEGVPPRVLELLDRYVPTEEGRGDA